MLCTGNESICPLYGHLSGAWAQPQVLEEASKSTLFAAGLDAALS